MYVRVCVLDKNETRAELYCRISYKGRVILQNIIQGMKNSYVLYRAAIAR
jgi:hypothetical protein